MATIQTDIIGKVINYHDMTPIVITSAVGEPTRVSLSADDRGVIIDEIYYPDFSGSIEFDIRDIVASELWLEIPEEGKDISQTRIFKTFSIDINSGEASGVFTVCGYAEDTTGRITDIDILAVPRDYKLPLSLCNNWQRSGLRYCFQDGSQVEEPDVLQTEQSVGIVSRMIDISASPAAGHKSFFIELDCIDTVLSSAVFQIIPENCEQYLFANRYGGFDNIPMRGCREFVPEMSFEAGLYDSATEQISAESDYIYSQNSGFQSRKVMELASELLCSSQIYHLDSDGEFRRIVIIESSLNTRSNDSLHSFSFKYKYADYTRPLSLKYKSTGVRSGNSDKTLVFPIADSPQKILHNKNKFPSVTVVDQNREAVVVSVEYPDSNNVIVSWTGELSGYVYIN